MVMDMNIKKADISDFSIVKDITLSTINSVYPHYYPKGAVDFFISHHKDKNIINDIEAECVFLIYDDKSIPVGTVTVKGNEINRLFVLENHQKKGFGRMLLDFAEKMILNQYNEITISASLPAKAIYLKRGYTAVSFHTISTDNGDFLCYDEMKKYK